MREGEPIFTGEVWVEGDTIRYVGDGRDLDDFYKRTGQNAPRWDREIDCRGNLLMPGFKNAHTHSAMTFLRSSADDMPLSDWLNQQVFPYEAKLTPEDIYTLSKLAILEYLTSGITAVMEMYLTPESIADAFEEMGLRLVQVGAVNNFSQSVDQVEEWFRTLNGRSPLTSFRLGFHAEYTCSRELLEQMAALSHKYQAPVYTHIAETKAEVEGCVERYGKTPVALLNELGLFEYGGAGYHLVHTTPEDRAILKQKGIAVVTNPASNTKLASGIAPIADYLREGIPVAIGTDGPASNNCLDMFREMFLVTGLAKLREGDASAVPAGEVLKMATVNGAHVLGQPQTDSLAEGKLADMILIDLEQPNMQPIQNIESNLVYSGSKLNVLMTMVNGHILYDRLQGGRAVYHVGEDPAAIYERAAQIRDRIFA
ncbi:MAG: amidohydrolase [Eubacteriales bacterium]|nr:amidohydrolase [Eubacteriales bacterium]